MNAEDVRQVNVWLNRMRENIQRATRLAGRIPTYDLDDDLVWALVKYTENVQEAAVQLDTINPKIYPALIEIAPGDWKALKGMRSRLVHQFWKIDPAIVQRTVEDDFPVLLSLLSTLAVIPTVIRYPGQRTSFTLRTKDLLGLPSAPPGSPTAGRNFVVMIFNTDGDVEVYRVGHRDGKLALIAPLGAVSSIWGKPARP